MKTVKTRPRIAIIGGGIAGLSLAHCLGKEAFDCHVFEQKPDFSQLGAAISVFPNALSVMDELGLLPSILSKAGVMSKLYLKTDRGRVLACSAPKYSYPTICMQRGDLHEVLLSNQPAVLHLGHRLAELVLRAEAGVGLRFEGQDTWQDFDMVVGADGLHSVLRRLVFSDSLPIYRGYQVWRGLSALDLGSEVFGSESFGLGQRFGLVPVSPKLYGWWAAVNEPEGLDDEPEGAKAKLLRLFGTWHDPLPRIIEHSPLILKHGVYDRPVEGPWFKGRAVLLGDAAHPTTPNLGQGGCMAIEGAYLLAAALKKYGLGSQAFEQYEKHQKKRAKDIVKQSLRLGQLGQTSSSFLAGFRNLAFRLTPDCLALRMVDKYFAYRPAKVAI